MGDIFQLEVTFGGNTKRYLKIHKDASIEELLEQIARWNGIDPTVQRVIFTSRELQMIRKGKKMYLSDYKIMDKSVLTVVITLVGGSDQDPLEGQVHQAKQLDDDVERSYLPDMITWDDDPENPRAKMPCGHAIGPASLTAYCRSLLSAGKSQIHCPYIDTKNSTYCGQVWEYFIVRRLAVLTEEEKKEFENRISQNYLRKSVGIQECPKCAIFCTRLNSKIRRVVCASCSKGGTRHEFCWYCLGEWKTSGTKSCGNTACTGTDPRLKVLKEAPLKEIVGLQGCPSIRACPKCGMLIQHIKACKQMRCYCGQKFCFICLTKAGTNGLYQCGKFNSHCAIAPIQKKILGTDDDDDDDDNHHDSGGRSSNDSWCNVM